MTDNGDGTFTIQNTKTGENRTVKAEELSSYGLKAPRDEGAFEGTITKTGAFDVPVLGGVARALTHPLLKGAETIAQAVGETGAALTGQTSAPQFVNPSMQKVLNNRTQAGTEGLTNPDATTGDLATRGIKTAAGVAAYGVPGGGFTGELTTKGLAAAGGLSSFGESGNTVGETVGDTALGAVLGPILARIPGLAGKLTGKTAETLFDKLPAGLRNKMDLTEKQLINLENRKMTDMVGYENISKAKTLGITPNSMPEDVIRLVTPEMEDVGSKLDEALGKDYANATIADITEAFNKAQKQVVPGTKEVNLKDFKSRTKDFLQQNIIDEMVSTGDTSVGQTVDFQNDTSPISLKIVNKIKQRLGERFDEDPIYKQAYKNLQQLIEEKSGDPDLVKSLNGEYNTLRNIKKASDEQIKKGLSHNIDEYDIRRERIKGNPLTDPLLATGASVGALGGAMLGPVGAIPGGTFALYRILVNLLKNPEVASKLAGTLEAPKEVFNTPVGQVVSKVAGKTTGVIGKALEQAGVRLPSRF